ncbi:hyaluronidase-1-like [Patiria miniata]|uniref:Hyaluronidase n=1 Tax=Patiria miniata TaxID=46514 RepID=A0A913ZBH6_PATMI|nr:hyaluronidase-1-like [Patiria miniata]
MKQITTSARQQGMNKMQFLAQWLLLILATGNICEVTPLTPRGRVAGIVGLSPGKEPGPSPLPPALADRAFTAVWNVRNSHRCLTKFGVDIDLGSNGILTNSPTGNDVMVYFGHEDLGLFPYIQRGHFVNGGLPQLVNGTAHLEKVAVDIRTAIPDANYSGLAVIDWEFWSPVWNKNIGVPGSELYNAESMALVRRRHPTWDQGTVEATAKTEFEEAARSLYEGTVLLAHQLRPKALFGFYHFPYCNNHADARYCNQTSVLSNDQMSWLTDASPSLYSSIYMKEEDTRTDTAVYIDTILQEAVRVRQNSKDPNKPMYSYVALNYSHTGLFLNLEDMNNSILLPAEQGLAGVVFWGDNNDTSNRAACLGLQKDVKLALGPLVLKTTQAAARCSASLCSGNGRCVGKILECISGAPSGVTPGRISKFGAKKSSACRCQCYNGWSGTNCSIGA